MCVTCEVCAVLPKDIGRVHSALSAAFHFPAELRSATLAIVAAVRVGRFAAAARERDMRGDEAAQSPPEVSSSSSSSSASVEVSEE